MARRRGPNEGSIVKRADGRWEARLNLGRVNGKRKRKYFHGHTREEANAMLLKAQRELQLGINVAPERQTVAQFLDHWLETVVKTRNRLRTVESYAQLIRLHLKPALGHVVLQKLTPQQVQSFLNEKHRSGLSPRTVQYLRGVLRAALGQAMRWELVTRNAAALATPPSSKRHETSFLDPEQARAFLEAADGHLYGVLFTVVLAIGLRLGEALGLRWSDIDLDDGVLTVRNQLQRVDGKLTLVEPKTEKARRTIPLPSFATTALRAHRAAQLEERLLHGDRWQDGDFVFTTSIGTPADERKIRRGLGEILKKAGLPSMRVHDLRHSCASLLLAGGVPARVAMEILGHSQVSTTLNLYSHVVPALKREAAETMDGLLGAG